MTVVAAVAEFGASRRAGQRPIVRSAAALTQILRPEQNACLLRRPLPPTLQRGLAGLDALESFERKRVVRSLSDLAWLTEPLGSQQGAVLVPDLSRWLEAFRQLVSGAEVTGCIAVTRTDDCRKYHVDWVGLRLIITYAGPGTEWVSDDGVRRDALQAPWRNLTAINRRIVPDPSRVVGASAGDVLVLKGESYPGNAGRGAVHRSPPLARSGGVRLLFKLTSPGSSCRELECAEEQPADAS
jgi:Protein of unknown function (DUF1826)